MPLKTRDDVFIEKLSELLQANQATGQHSHFQAGDVAQGKAADRQPNPRAGQGSDRLNPTADSRQQQDFAGGQRTDKRASGN